MLFITNVTRGLIGLTKNMSFSTRTIAQHNGFVFNIILRSLDKVFVFFVQYLDVLDKYLS